MCMWEVFVVRTNIVIDDLMMDEAMKISKAKTKKEMIRFALEEYIANHKKKNLMELKGKVTFNENYDYKAMREGK